MLGGELPALPGLPGGELMANLSIRQAVQHFDVSRPTLTKALKSGKVAGVQDGQGQWQIDPAELIRVYKPRPGGADNAAKPEPVSFPSANTPLAGEVEALRERLSEAEKRAAVAEALADERLQHLEDLRRLLPRPAPAPVAPEAGPVAPGTDPVALEPEVELPTTGQVSPSSGGPAPSNDSALSTGQPKTRTSQPEPLPSRDPAPRRRWWSWARG